MKTLPREKAHGAEKRVGDPTGKAGYRIKAFVSILNSLGIICIEQDFFGLGLRCRGWGRFPVFFSANCFFLIC